jgi:hypothetical protein
VTHHLCPLLLIIVAGCELSGPARATVAQQGPSLESRFSGAERVLVGTVERLSSAFGTNEHGDHVILSTVTVRVQERLRGEAAETASFEIEGGTVGQLTLEVSDQPSPRAGDRGVFALRRSAAGRWVPNRRGHGILLAAGGLDLERLRRAEAVSR